MPQRKDPLHDESATLSDFVYRLRRMGYPGNVRVEFPIWTPEDGKWAAKIVSDTGKMLSDIVQQTDLPPLIRVLRARAAVVEMDRELRLRTSNKLVTREMKQASDGAG